MRKSRLFWSRSTCVILDSQNPKWIYMWLRIVYLSTTYFSDAWGMCNPRSLLYSFEHVLHFGRYPDFVSVNRAKCFNSFSSLHLVQTLVSNSLFNCGFSVFLYMSDNAVGIFDESDGVSNHWRVVHFFQQWNHFSQSDALGFTDIHIDEDLRHLVSCFQINHNPQCPESHSSKSS